MVRKHGICTLLELFALTVCMIFMAGINAYGRDGGAKSPPPSAVAKTDPNEWKKIVEAANKEGKIVIAGVPGEGWRKSMVDMFQQEYPEIKVEYSSTPGRVMLPRIARRFLEVFMRAFLLSILVLAYTLAIWVNKKTGNFSAPTAFAAGPTSIP